MRGLRIKTPHDRQIIGVQLIKTYLRIDGDDEDELLQMFRDGAINRLEDYLNTAFAPQTYLYRLDTPPLLKKIVKDGGMTRDRGYYGGNSYTNYTFESLARLPEVFAIPTYPLISIVSLKIFTRDGQEVTIDPSNYTVDTNGTGQIIMNDNFQWPTSIRLVNGVLIEYEAGHASSDVVPNGIKEAMFELIAYNYNNRHESGASLPEHIISEIKHHRTFGFDYEYGA